MVHFPPPPPGFTPTFVAASAANQIAQNLRKPRNILLVLDTRTCFKWHLKPRKLYIFIQTNFH